MVSFFQRFSTFFVKTKTIITFCSGKPLGKFYVLQPFIFSLLRRIRNWWEFPKNSSNNNVSGKNLFVDWPWTKGSLLYENNGMWLSAFGFMICGDLGSTLHQHLPNCSQSKSCSWSNIEYFTIYLKMFLEDNLCGYCDWDGWWDSRWDLINAHCTDPAMVESQLI